MVAGRKHAREVSDDSGHRKNAKRDQAADVDEAAARGEASSSSPLQATAPPRQGTSPPRSPNKTESREMSKLQQATDKAVASAQDKLNSDFVAAAAAGGRDSASAQRDLASDFAAAAAAAGAPGGKDPSPSGQDPPPRADGPRHCERGPPCGSTKPRSISSLQLGEPAVGDGYHVYNKMTLRAGFPLCTFHIAKCDGEVKARLAAVNSTPPEALARHTFIFVDVASSSEGQPLDNRERDHAIVQIAAVVASSRELTSTQAINNAGGGGDDGSPGGSSSCCRPSSRFNIYVQTDDDAAKAGTSKQPAAAGSADGPAEAEQQGASTSEAQPEGSPVEAPASAVAAMAAAAAAAAADMPLPPAEALQLFWDWVLEQHVRSQGAGADPGDIILVSHYGYNYAFRLLAQQAEQLGLRMPPVQLADSQLWHKARFRWCGNNSKLPELTDELGAVAELMREDQQQAAGDGASQQQQQPQLQPQRQAFKSYRREHRFALADVRAMLVIVQRLAEQLQKRPELGAGAAAGDGSQATTSADDIWRRGLLALSTPLRDYVGRLGLQPDELVG